MDETRAFLYGGIFAILCATMCITHCTYQEGSCRKDAIKAGLDADKIVAVCKVNK